MDIRWEYLHFASISNGGLA